MRQIWKRTCVAGAILVGGGALFTGCASVPKDAGFPNVQQNVTDRSGARIHWDQGTAADREVADVVRALLRRPLSADDAVQVALLNNQNLQATYEDLGIAQAELVEAGLLKNPRLGAEVRFPRYHALPFDVDVVGSLLDLLMLPLRKRQAGAAFEAAQGRVTHAVLTTAADTKAAFYRAQAAAQLMELRRSVEQATAASFDAARRLHDAGNVSDLALANERALHEQAKLDLARAEADVQDAREELNALMGAWGAQTSWTIDPRLPDVPQAEVELRGLESLAMTQRADLQAARAELAGLGQALGLARYAIFGDVSVTGHLERDTDGSTSFGPGIEVPLPIFNQGQPAVAAAQARLGQGQKRYAALAVEIRAQVRRARQRMFAARERSEYYRRVILPLRQQIVEQTQLQYNGMLVGVFQLLQAKRDEIDAGREFVESLRDYWIARAELERAIGGRLTTAMPATQPAGDAQTRPATGEDQHGQVHVHAHGD